MKKKKTAEEEENEIAEIREKTIYNARKTDDGYWIIRNGGGGHDAGFLWEQRRDIAEMERLSERLSKSGRKALLMKKVILAACIDCEKHMAKRG